jgi:hypothetical protein
VGRGAARSHWGCEHIRRKDGFAANVAQRPKIFD